MTYVCWAVMFEGNSDRAYFEVLIPRVVELITAEHGVRSVTVPTSPAVFLKRGSAQDVAHEACRHKEAFYLVFVHADAGGRNLEKTVAMRSTDICDAMETECDWPRARCIPIVPRKEMEAWLLCDPAAVCESLGFRGKADDLGLPDGGKAAEHLEDPKATLTAAIRHVRKNRFYDAKQLYGAIAQRQSRNQLRTSPSYVEFEDLLYEALVSLGCVRPRSNPRGFM